MFPPSEICKFGEISELSDVALTSFVCDTDGPPLLKSANYAKSTNNPKSYQPVLCDSDGPPPLPEISELREICELSEVVLTSFVCVPPL